mmetsp:Transcript_72502/g.198642  ORF Transcript_72502/g.198642 Transcript_72502/m.198642 type:complete len:311 (+) Transcript_72502:249-1181(+)
MYMHVLQLRAPKVGQRRPPPHGARAPRRRQPAAAPPHAYDTSTTGTPPTVDVAPSPSLLAHAPSLRSAWARTTLAPCFFRSMRYPKSMHSATKSSDPRMTRYQLHSRRSEGLYTSLVQRVRPGTGYLTHACSCSTLVATKPPTAKPILSTTFWKPKRKPSLRPLALRTSDSSTRSALRASVAMFDVTRKVCAQMEMATMAWKEPSVQLVGIAPESCSMIGSGIRHAATVPAAMAPCFFPNILSTFGAMTNAVRKAGRNCHLVSWRLLSDPSSKTKLLRMNCKWRNMPNVVNEQSCETKRQTKLGSPRRAR